MTPEEIAAKAAADAAQAAADADTAQSAADAARPNKKQPAAAPVPEPVRKFRVLHGAVAGVGRNKKGELIDQDYSLGVIVTSAQLDNNEADYLVMGAIEEIA